MYLFLSDCLQAALKCGMRKQKKNSCHLYIHLPPSPDHFLDHVQLHSSVEDWFCRFHCAFHKKNSKGAGRKKERPGETIGV